MRRLTKTKTKTFPKLTPITSLKPNRKSREGSSSPVRIFAVYINRNLKEVAPDGGSLLAPSDGIGDVPRAADQHPGPGHGPGPGAVRSAEPRGRGGALRRRCSAARSTTSHFRTPHLAHNCSELLFTRFTWLRTFSRCKKAFQCLE